jgi:hypothetical protein
MSGLRWHERFADCLLNEGFSPCNAEPDIWMRLNGDLYEYVATYVDDLCLGMLDPKPFTDTLQKKYNFKLKGTGPIDFHLGQSFSRNEDGEMEISAKCYVDKMIDMFNFMGRNPEKLHLHLNKMIIWKWMTLLSSDKTRHSSSNHSLEPCNGQYQSEDLISQQL